MSAAEASAPSPRDPTHAVHCRGVEAAALNAAEYATARAVPLPAPQKAPWNPFTSPTSFSCKGKSLPDALSISVPLLLSPSASASPHSPRAPLLMLSSPPPVSTQQSNASSPQLTQFTSPFTAQPETTIDVKSAKGAEGASPTETCSVHGDESAEEEKIDVCSLKDSLLLKQADAHIATGVKDGCFKCLSSDPRNTSSEAFSRTCEWTLEPHCARTAPGLMRLYSDHKRSRCASLRVDLAACAATPPASPISPGTMVLPRMSLEASTMTSPTDRAVGVLPTVTASATIKESCLESVSVSKTFASNVAAPHSPASATTQPSAVLPRTSEAAGMKETRAMPPMHLLKDAAPISAASDLPSPSYKKSVQDTGKSDDCSSVSSVPGASVPLSHWPPMPSAPSYWLHPSPLTGMEAAASLGYAFTRDPLTGQFFLLASRPHPMQDPNSHSLMWAGYGGLATPPVVLTPEQLLLDARYRTALHSPAPLMHMHAAMAAAAAAVQPPSLQSKVKKETLSPVTSVEESKLKSSMPLPDLTTSLPSDVSPTLQSIPRTNLPHPFLYPPSSLPYYYPPPAPQAVSPFGLPAYATPPPSASLGLSGLLASLANNSFSPTPPPPPMPVFSNPLASSAGTAIHRMGLINSFAANNSETLSTVWSRNLFSTPSPVSNGADTLLDLSQRPSKSSKVFSAQAKQKESRYNALRIKKEIKEEMISPVIRENFETAEIAKSELKCDRNKQEVLRASTPHSGFDLTPKVLNSNVKNKSLSETSRDDEESQKRTLSSPRLTVLPTPVATAIDSSGLELLLQTFLAHGDRLAPSPPLAESERESVSSHSASMPLLERAERTPSPRFSPETFESQPPVLTPFALPSDKDSPFCSPEPPRLDMFLNTPSSIYSKPPLSTFPNASTPSTILPPTLECTPQNISLKPPSGLSVLCALAEQRILEEEQNCCSALSSLAEVASSTPLAPTNEACESSQINAPKGEHFLQDVLRKKSTNEDLTEDNIDVRNTDINRNYENDESNCENSQKSVILKQDTEKSIKMLLSVENQNKLDCKDMLPGQTKLEASANHEETEVDGNSTDIKLFPNVASTLDPLDLHTSEEPKREESDEDAGFRESKLCDIASTAASLVLHQVESSVDSPTSDAELHSFSSSKKRKPGRPKKHSPTKLEATETIVAKKPKTLEFLLYSQKNKILPKLKAELKIRKPDHDDESATVNNSEKATEQLCEETEEQFAKKNTKAKKSVCETPGRAGRRGLTGHTSLSRNTVLRDKENRKTVFEKNTQMQELFRSLKRYSAIADQEHDESEDEKEEEKSDDEASSTIASAATIFPDVAATSTVNGKNTLPSSEKQILVKEEMETQINSERSLEADARCKRQLTQNNFAESASPVYEKDKESALGCSVCSLQVGDLVLGARVLVLQEGLLYAASVAPITPPDVYAIHVDGERATRPRICCQEELLTQAWKEVKPGTTRFLTEGTRVCAFWSQQYRGLYPGCVAAASSPSPEGSHNLVNVEFDDGDSGRIHVDDVRLLPQDFPIIEYDPNPLLSLNKRKRRSTEEDASEPLKKEPRKDRRSSCCAENNDEVPQEAANLSSERVQLYKSPSNSSCLSFTSEETPKKRKKRRKRSNSSEATPYKRKRKRKHKHHHRRESSATSSQLFPHVEQGDGELRMRIRSPPPQPARRKRSLQSSTEEEKSSIEDDESLQPSRKKRRPSEKSKIALFLLERQLWSWAGKSYRKQGAKGKAKKQFYREIVRGKEQIKVGDCAVFLSSGSHERPFIGKIDFLWEAWGGNMVVKVRWFYHPDETSGTERKLAEPEGALFSSSHTDENDVQTISHKCHVVSLADCRARRAALGDHDAHDLYYLAGFYDPTYERITMEPGVS